jgi:hypothetical protein
MATMQKHGHSSWMDLSYAVVDHRQRRSYEDDIDRNGPETEIVQTLSSVPERDDERRGGRPAGRMMQRRHSTDILARENIMALLDELSDSDGDDNDHDDNSIDTMRLEAMAQEQQLQKQFNRNFSVHEAVAMTKSSKQAEPSSAGGGGRATRGKRPPSAAKLDQDFIVTALSRNDLFLDLDLSQERIAEAAMRFERASYADGTVILEQGDDDFQSMYWYLIAKGRCQVLIDGRPLPRMGRYGGLTRGKTFGEVSLMREEARSATIVAEGEVVLYQLARRDFLEVIEMTHALGSNDTSKEKENHIDGDDDDQQQAPGNTSVGSGGVTAKTMEEASASGASNQRQWSEDLTEDRTDRYMYEESMPQLADVAKEEGGSSSGLLGSWYDQTSTRMAPLMQRGESAASIAAKSSAMHRVASTGGFAQKFFSIVGAGLKEEIGEHAQERPTKRMTWAGP